MINISYCTTCYNRLWQLKETLKHNIKYIKEDTELVVIAWNDSSVKPYLESNYKSYIDKEQIRVIEINESVKFIHGEEFSCGHVKHYSHLEARGRVLFNLDADNYIDDVLEEALYKLKDDELIITLRKEHCGDGRSGRIGITKNNYKRVRYYAKGREDDIDFIIQCARYNLKLVEVPCLIKPIPNDIESYYGD